MKYISIILFIIVVYINGENEKLEWTEKDGLYIKIIKSIKKERCKIVSQIGDIVEQYYKLSDEKGNIIGSNWGKKPYTFKLGNKEVIEGMERAMTGMCIGEIRKVVIPGYLGFGNEGRNDDNIEPNQTLYYKVELVNIQKVLSEEEWIDEDGLKIKITNKIELSKCKKSSIGDKIYQHYTLKLEDGTFIESSYTNDKPYVFILGTNSVIEGIEKAMTNMCEGEKRQVTIPYKLGYGIEGSPPDIPPMSTLIFDIYLYKLIKKDEL
ncbi:Peptidyl-prolyl cis-trans isomerase, FKBP-type,domain-containing protein [Strongyloides ratti]|uniref:peptidylprolyl isomerase n=1 Tax=Strongyloides ratti TaxID=34506 RepID=A0A090KU93_STRRB|nr:Peptidyl-prolyl cis-trans isomerase, FKBP-type,domain-containing protein [Strongyloides ratti]CEF61075.1 Peptidyl-prolyl cis-trans isomerase, FKBP-type,domain-containing protein [Strongyloides ratti]